MSGREDERPRVVFDINVYMDYLRQSDGKLLIPQSEDAPTSSSAADALAFAFDERVKLFASPHIFRNIDRLMRHDGQTPSERERFLTFIADVCDTSGGGFIDPVVTDHAIGDHEDNHILSLARDPAVDARVVVSSDHHLTDIGPIWHGRIITGPRMFVSRALRGNFATSVEPPKLPTAPVPSFRQAPADRYPELRGIELDPLGLRGTENEGQVNDDYQP